MLSPLEHHDPRAFAQTAHACGETRAAGYSTNNQDPTFHERTHFVIRNPGH